MINLTREEAEHILKLLDKFDTFNDFTDVREPLRARLSAPEPEPVAWITTWNEPNDAGVELHWAKQDKGLSSRHTPLFYKYSVNTNCEPIGWLYKTNNTWEQFSFVEPPDDAYDEGSLRPVFTAPPQREWVGLTDEEMFYIYGKNHEGKLCSLGRLVEAKLKEKNSGY